MLIWMPDFVFVGMPAPVVIANLSQVSWMPSSLLSYSLVASSFASSGSYPVRESSGKKTDAAFNEEASSINAICLLILAERSPLTGLAWARLIFIHVNINKKRAGARVIDRVNSLL